VAAQCKVWACGRSVHGIAGSNSAGGMNVCLLRAVCCQREVAAKGRSLTQRISTACGVTECDREVSTVRRPWPKRGCQTVIYIFIYLCIYLYTYLMYFFIHIHPAVFTVTEIRTKYTATHKPLMLYNNVLHVSAHQNHRRTPLIQKFKNISTVSTCKYFVTEIRNDVRVFACCSYYYVH
jgi:hypothetical protein